MYIVWKLKNLSPHSEFNTTQKTAEKKNKQILLANMQNKVIIFK